MSHYSYDSHSTNVDSDYTNATINININNYDVSDTLIEETDASRTLKSVLKEVFLKRARLQIFAYNHRGPNGALLRE